MAPRHVDPADWLLVWWHLQAIPRRTAIHDLARQSALLRDIQHNPCPGDSRYSWLWWYFPPPLLHLHFCRLLLLQSALFLPPGDFALLMIRLVSQTSCPPIFSPLSPAFHGSVGSPPIMSRSTSCLESHTEWQWVS
jgi:hypothetical protein